MSVEFGLHIEQGTLTTKPFLTRVFSLLIINNVKSDKLFLLFVKHWELGPLYWIKENKNNCSPPSKSKEKVVTRRTMLCELAPCVLSMEWIREAYTFTTGQNKDHVPGPALAWPISGLGSWWKKQWILTWIPRQVDTISVNWRLTFENIWDFFFDLDRRLWMFLQRACLTNAVFYFIIIMNGSVSSTIIKLIII